MYRHFFKRVIDIIISLVAIIITSPILLILVILVNAESKGGFLFKQKRMGRNAKPFEIFKIRSMYVNQGNTNQLVTVNNDSRITKTGKWIRKYKLDELPQFYNVLFGDISIVGPRPEVFKYESYYSGEYAKVLSVKPGITDLASLKFIDESSLLSASDDVEKTYTEQILPEKLRINLEYVENVGFIQDVSIIIKTFIAIIR